jgi:hypothetical protein
VFVSMAGRKVNARSLEAAVLCELVGTGSYKESGGSPM